MSLVSIKRPEPEDFTQGDEIRVWRTISAIPAPVNFQPERILMVQECVGVWVLEDGEVRWDPWDPDGPVLSRTIWRRLTLGGKLTASSSVPLA
jgi:hypothetical protein